MKGMLLIGLLLPILAITWFFPLGALYGLVGGAAGYFISEGFNASIGWLLFFSVFGFFSGISLYAKLHDNH